MNILDHLQNPQFRLVAQIRLPVLGAPGKRPLPRLPAATMLADLYRLGWRTELVLQMPRERAQPLGVAIPLALCQVRDVTPPGVSPLAEDADVVRSLRFYFLTARIPLAAAQVRHLISPERLAFGSVTTSRQATPALLALFAGRLDHPSAAAGTCPPCVMLALVLLPPPALPGKQPGVRTQ